MALLSVPLSAHSPAQRGGAKDSQRALDDGAALERSGDAAGALESYRWALEASAANSPERARALMALSQVKKALGQYADASRDAAAAGDVYEALGDSKGVASTLNRRGGIAQIAGDYAEAERLFTAALDRSTSIGDREGRAEHLANLANSQFYVGRYADAARMYDEALALTSGAADEPWAARRRRLILANQAALYQRLGRDQQALALYSQLGSANSGLSPREQAEMLVNLGVLYRRLGDPIKALRTYDDARALFAQERAVDGELNVLKNRGIALALDLGRLNEAEQNFSIALETATRIGDRRGMLHALLYRGETRLRSGQPAQAREDFSAGLSIARDLRTPEEEWKALFGMGRVETQPARAIEYLDEAVRTIEAIREAIRVQSLRSDFLTDKRVVYDALISARMTTAPPEVTFNLLERSHSRVWRDRLGLAKPIDLASVQRALPEGLLLLDYWQSANGSAVIAVSRSRAAVIPVEADTARIQELIDAMSAGASPNWRALAQDVASRVLPSPDWFAGVDRVVVVPDGALAIVPFEVLPIDGRLLIERAAVSYTPTAATLVRPRSPARDWVPPWRLQLRVFADPVFASAALDDMSRVRQRLTGSADEARGVASELAGRAVLHLGADSRKSYLFAAGEHAPILHLATHAVADASAMEQSRIVFSPAPGSGAAADYLFLKEAYALPLGDVELAVLSACDTARGRLVDGEGVQSFSRAFLASGVRSTVTTMWRVADGPTANFMQVFYHHLQRGLPRDEALRRAKLRFLEPGSTMADPHFWAAFVLTGDALRPIPRSLSWKVAGSAAAGMIVIAVLAVRQYRSRGRPSSSAGADQHIASTTQ
jgi:tetratricopeptide (TPR) repeat protein